MLAVTNFAHVERAWGKAFLSHQQSHINSFMIIETIFTKQLCTLNVYPDFSFGHIALVGLICVCGKYKTPFGKNVSSPKHKAKYVNH